MTPMAFPIGPTEMIIILVIVLVLFGGARLAGLGKSTGRAIREFKEETKNLGGDKSEDVVDAEVVEPQNQQSQQQNPPAVGGAQQQQAPQEPQQQSAQQSGGSSTQSTQSYGSATQPTEARRDA
ncbi:mttA/Hcf106 family protein [Microlunatus soli]|uniref:Sec-independent protein translocase protein TatA n=1 Tax=Microlunatus soli TaxID=630515 RepID=A0A1H1Y0W8_9ACTN|nr:mttA/Hcf106 family protein [Microlunatus soli]